MTTCSNNYGPCQFPEKLIPLTILEAIEGEAPPVYGRGEIDRGVLFVQDHALPLRAVLAGREAGGTYGIGEGCELRGIEVIRDICATWDELRCDEDGRYEHLIELVADRPLHDCRYAIDGARQEAV